MTDVMAAQCGLHGRHLRPCAGERCTVQQRAGTGRWRFQRHRTGDRGDLAQLGFELTLWGQNRDKLATTMDMCRRYQQTVADAQIDVTHCSQLSSAVQDLTSRAPLTAVVWAAGLFERLPTEWLFPGAALAGTRGAALGNRLRTLGTDP